MDDLIFHSSFKVLCVLEKKICPPFPLGTFMQIVMVLSPSETVRKHSHWQQVWLCSEHSMAQTVTSLGTKW